jgi:hypothetical protein
MAAARPVVQGIRLFGKLTFGGKSAEHGKARIAAYLLVI